MPKRSSQGYFEFTAQMPLTKTEDQIKTEKLLAQEMRENPEPEPASRAVVNLDMRARMRAQRVANEKELREGKKNADKKT